MSSLEKKMNILKNEEDFRALGLSMVGPGGCDRSTSIKTHNRVFRAHFGAGWKTVAYLWKFLKKVEEDVSKEQNEMKKSIFEKKHLLMCLYFFKVYNSEDTAAKSLGCCPKTYRKWSSKCAKDIAFLYPFFVSIELEKKFRLFHSPFVLFFSFLSFPQIKLSNRYKGDKGNDCLLSVDTTDCRIQEPHPFEKGYSERWSSHKFGKKAGLRYELALSIASGHICWSNGPYPCGTYNDWKIFNECGLRSRLDENERVEADKGYRFGDPEFCKTPAGVFHDEKKKEIRNRVMARQEALNARLKNFAILKKPFRNDIEDHGEVFRAILVIVQISIEFGGDKLFDCDEYCD